MKRVAYIGAFTFLGLLVATLIHAGVELPALHYLATTEGAYQDTFLGMHWEQIHRVGGTLLWLAGFAGGMWCGVRYWRIIYVEKPNTKKR